MNQIEQLMALADEYAEYSNDGYYSDLVGPARQALRAAIEAALKDEREACAKLAERGGRSRDGRIHFPDHYVAGAIRGRSE